MHIFILIIYLTNKVFAYDGMKYIDLLPEKEKEEFLDRIARRILAEVKVKENKDLNKDVSNKELDSHHDFVKNIINEESNKLNMNVKPLEPKNDVQKRSKRKNLSEENNNGDLQDKENQSDTDIEVKPTEHTNKQTQLIEFEVDIQSKENDKKFGVTQGIYEEYGKVHETEPTEETEMTEETEGPTTEPLPTETTTDSPEENITNVTESVLTSTLVLIIKEATSNMSAHSRALKDDLMTNGTKDSGLNIKKDEVTTEFGVKSKNMEMETTPVFINDVKKVKEAQNNLLKSNFTADEIVNSKTVKENKIEGINKINNDSQINIDAGKSVNDLKETADTKLKTIENVDVNKGRGEISLELKRRETNSQESSNNLQDKINDGQVTLNATIKGKHTDKSATKINSNNKREVSNSSLTKNDSKVFKIDTKQRKITVEYNNREDKINNITNLEFHKLKTTPSTEAFGTKSTGDLNNNHNLKTAPSIEPSGTKSTKVLNNLVTTEIPTPLTTHRNSIKLNTIEKDKTFSVKLGNTVNDAIEVIRTKNVDKIVKMNPLQTFYEVNRGKVHEVFEIAENDTPFEKTNQNIEHPHLVPIYEYSSKNAYYNAYNRFGPNEDDALSRSGNRNTDFHRDYYLPFDDNRKFRFGITNVVKSTETPHFINLPGIADPRPNNIYSKNYDYDDILIERTNKDQFDNKKIIEAAHFDTINRLRHVLIEKKVFDFNKFKETPKEILDIHKRLCDRDNVLCNINGIQNNGSQNQSNNVKVDLDFKDKTTDFDRITEIKKSENIKAKLNNVLKIINDFKNYDNLQNIELNLNKEEFNEGKINIKTKSLENNEHVIGLNEMENIQNGVENGSIQDGADAKKTELDTKVMKNKTKLNMEELKTLLSHTDTNKLIPLVDKLKKLNVIEIPSKKSTPIEIYVEVLKDIINCDDRALKQFGWLRTTVNILAAITKLNILIDSIIQRVYIPPQDFQLLSYVTYLHTSALHQTAESLVDENLRKKVLPKSRKKKKGLIRDRGLINRVWLYRMLQNSADPLINDKNLQELQDFLNSLENNLYNLHTAIKHISKTTHYNNQNWYSNLKEVYMNTSDKRLLELLTHFTASRLFDLIQDGGENGVQNNYIDYIKRNSNQVERTKEEFVFLIQLLDQFDYILNN